MERIINSVAKPNSMIYKSWVFVILITVLFGLYYYVIERIYLLIISIFITFAITLATATTACNSCYFKGLIFNTTVTFLICFYPLFYFEQKIALIFLGYCLFDGYWVKRKFKQLFTQLNPIQSTSQTLSNRDQFSLDHELNHGRVWQLQYHLPLLLLITVIIIPLTFMAKSVNSYFLFVPVSLFFSFLIWEYTLKRFIYFYYLFKIQSSQLKT